MQMRVLKLKQSQSVEKGIKDSASKVVSLVHLTSKLHPHLTQTLMDSFTNQLDVPVNKEDGTGNGGSGCVIA